MRMGIPDTISSIPTKYGYKKTMGGLSHMFKPEFWNYAKLISGVLRHEMPIQDLLIWSHL